VRVRTLSVDLDRGLGLDVAILDEAATVADLCEAYAAASDDENLDKEERFFPGGPQRGTCFGCTFCCGRFNIFLSMIDVLQLSMAEGISRDEFIAYCTTYEPWKVDRMRLADPVSYCLREDNQGCRKYEIRPLICRLFICCPHTERARQLIAAVNRLAEEDLVNWRNQRPDPANPFHGKFSYSQIRLRDCVSDELWHDLFTPEPHSRPA
jgi:Fe-S-cluster containining protein